MKSLDQKQVLGMLLLATLLGFWLVIQVAI